jgi:hypothetical protein
MGIGLVARPPVFLSVATRRLRSGLFRRHDSAHGGKAGKRLAKPATSGYFLRPFVRFFATLAQLVERLIRNEQVIGSSPVSGSRLFRFGRVVLQTLSFVA